MKEALSVKAVSMLSGIGPHTLRAWERRYKAVVPTRTVTGRRIYSLADVERLKLLGKLVATGHSIGTIAKLSNADLEKLIRAMGAEVPMPSAVQASNALVSSDDPEIVSVVNTVIQALKVFDLNRLSQELTYARMKFSTRTFVLKVVPPLMKAVGDKVESEAFCSAQEHALTAILRDHLGQVLQSFTSHRGSSPLRIVLATPEDELHEFGTLLGAILSASRGVHTHYLGPNLPARDLALAARGLRAQVVVVGASSIPAGETKVTLESYLKALDLALPNNVEIWFGGDRKYNEKKVRIKHALRRLESLDALDELLSRSVH